jgi:hypothetical protein
MLDFSHQIEINNTQADMRLWHVYQLRTGRETALHIGPNTNEYLRNMVGVSSIALNIDISSPDCVSRHL